MRLLLDTNCLTAALRGDSGTADLIEQAAEVWVPFVALAEIKAGFAGGTRAGKNEALLHTFLSLPGVSVLFADRETTDVYARLIAQLRRAGTPIPTNDLWIASLAVQHELPLLSRDRHFRKVAQVALV